MLIILFDGWENNDIILSYANKLKRPIIDKTLIPCKSQTVASGCIRFPKAQESNEKRQTFIIFIPFDRNQQYCVRLWATLVVISATNRQVWSFRRRRQRRCKVKRLCLIKLRILLLYTRMMRSSRRVHLNQMYVNNGSLICTSVCTLNIILFLSANC